ncbi:Chitinase-like protein C25A8.4 [Aphelenchoides besseyi]|nr:Chitinase-like protein C25A8.4 [Aphelenchoides besseyi]
MRERYRSVVLLLCFLISIGLRTKVSAAENEDIELQDSNSCSFFCFLLAKEVSDECLQQQQRPAKLFLAIREKERINFIDSSYARAKVINNIIQKAVFHYFDGIFLNLRSTSLLSFHYENFIRELRTELNVRATATSQKPLQLVVAVNAQNVFEAHRKLGTFAHMIDQLYLKSDEIISAVDENTAVLVEPLYGDTHTQLLDTISETAESIIAAGVPAEQIVIGLSSWARGYNLASNLTVNGAPVYDFVQMDDSMRSDGRFALQEVRDLVAIYRYFCSDFGAVSFVLNETQFFSYNPPQHESVARKIRWISSHGYGGIGVMQLEADDPTNHCGLGKYPLATAIAKQFKCSKRQHDQEKTTSCNRVCIYRPNVDHISYERLMPNWCSHIVVSSIEFKGDGSISETNEFKGAIVEYAKWSVTRKPFLILSIGAEMYWNHWNSLITNSSARHVFVQNARQIYVDSNAHGLELSLLDPIEVSEEIAQKVQTEFSNLLDELRKEMPKNALIFVTVTPFLTFANAYNVDMLNRNTDFIILEGHRFHHSPAFTGHHSPLFSDSKLLANSNMSIESMANAWSSYPNDRILVGFSSLGTRMSLPVGTTHQQQERSDDDSFLGLSTETSRTDRSTGSGLCEELVGSSTIHQYIAELGIPVAKKDNEFFAYDDVRSIQTKTIWSSMNGFGGVAFHAIEADNANGKCPSGQPFSLLRKIADTQTCQQCVQSKTEEQSKCDPDPFSVICSYRLPDEKDQQPMLPATIPFENCSEVVVEDLLWSADGHLRFRDQKSRDQLIALTELRETNQLAKQTRLIAAVKCGMLPKKMEEMLSSNRNLTASILEHLHRYNFDGVELRCDHTLTEKTRKSFLHFNLLLIEQLKGYHHHDACAATLSIRIPVSNNNLTEKYDIQLLNSDSTVNNWIDSGVQAKKIIVHIPSYGIVQNFSTTVKAFGAGVQSNYTMIAQRDICTLLRRPNVHQHTFYDMIAAYATTPENQWITYETPSILRYKVNYAIREHLGGVGLVPLNRDDFQNNCGNGAFPLLNTIKQSICTV